MTNVTVAGVNNVSEIPAWIVINITYTDHVEIAIEVATMPNNDCEYYPFAECYGCVILDCTDPWDVKKTQEQKEYCEHHKKKNNKDVIISNTLFTDQTLVIRPSFDLTLNKIYAVMYVVDDNVHLASFKLERITEEKVIFKCGSGWLNIPKNVIIGITDEQATINKSLFEILTRPRKDFPMLNTLDNIGKARIENRLDVQNEIALGQIIGGNF